MRLRILGVLLAASALVFAVAGVSGQVACASSATRGRIDVLHVASEDADVPVRNVWVYRPSVPDSASLPVVYFLHGLPGSAADLFKAGGTATLDRMIADGLPPFVVAAPTGSGHARYDTEWADAVDGTDRIESYVVDRVIPAVEGVHPRDRAHRFIAGFSMGGYGAANIALRHPDLFAGAASFAGYFKIDDPDAVFGSDRDVEAANDPGRLVRSEHAVQFWVGDGTSDTERVVQGEAVRFAKAAGSLVAPQDLVLAPGGHSYQFVLSQFPALARFVARIAPPAPRTRIARTGICRVG